MFPLMLLSLGCLGSLQAAPQQAPEKPEPIEIVLHSKHLQLRKLAAHSASYGLYRGQGPGRMKLQTVRREFAAIQRAGEDYLRTSWHTRAMGREVVDELLLDPQSLAPRARQIPMPDGGMAYLKIRGAEVVGEIKDANGQTTEELKLRFSATLLEPSLPLLLALPRKAGAEFKLASMPLDLDQTPAEPNWVKISIGERSSIEVLEGISLDCWTLQVESLGGGQRVRYWLADEEPFVLRKELEVPGLGQITWELETED